MQKIKVYLIRSNVSFVLSSMSIAPIHWNWKYACDFNSNESRHRQHSIKKKHIADGFCVLLLHHARTHTDPILPAPSCSISRPRLSSHFHSFNRMKYIRRIMIYWLQPMNHMWFVIFWLSCAKHTKSNISPERSIRTCQRYSVSIPFHSSRSLFPMSTQYLLTTMQLCTQSQCNTDSMRSIANKCNISA